MGGVRAAVGVVLGVISLAVLSLHIALCIHYPSPLFAVTLLLNPSLWLFLGLIGMGCALLLTHRDQQRKVRAGRCISCHTQYGSTVDTKWRSQDEKLHGGQYCQRGPSRAIYSYNGNLHKFYASYGTINEKQLIEMKHSYLKAPFISKHNISNVQNIPVKSDGKEDLQNDARSNAEQTKETDSMKTQVEETKTVEENTDDSVSKEGVERANQALQTCKEETSDSSSKNCSKDEIAKDSGKAANEDKDQVRSVDESQVKPVQENSNHRTSGVNLPTGPSGQEILNGEMRYCDCLARYGAIYQYSRFPRGALPPRYQRYSSHDRAMRRYNRKLLMHCKLKPSNEVPVELFAAKKKQSGDISEDPGCVNSVSGDEKGEHLGSDEVESTDTNQFSPENKKAEPRKSSSGDTLQTPSKDSNVKSGNSVIHAVNHSGLEEAVDRHVSIGSKAIVPLKNIAHYCTLTSVSVPLGSPYNGKSKPPDHLEDFDSTSVSSDMTPSEQDGQDQDVLSISSKSSLLPSSPEKSMTSRDLTRSPLWHPFKSSKLGRKKISGEEKANLEDGSRVSQLRSSLSRQASTNEDIQESPSATLKSVFTSKRCFSKPFTGAENTSVKPTCETSKVEDKELPKDTTGFPKPRKVLNKRITSSSKAHASQKNPRSLILSPARAVRSLVFRNAQMRVSRGRKVQESKSQSGDAAPVSLPLLSSPEVDGLVKKPPLTTNTIGSSNVPPFSASASSDVTRGSVSTTTSKPLSDFLSSAQVSECSSQSLTDSNVKSSQPFGADNLECVTSFPVRTSSVSASAISPTSLATATAFTATTTAQTPIASSSSPNSSPSVRPKEPKKPRLRLKGKHRTRAAESVMLLQADSED